MFDALKIKNSIAVFINHQKILFLFLTIVAGIFALWPFHDFQWWLAQGDHGRDLYCFKRTMEGALPYRDYSWVFGPLMPYYYSAFYHLFGVNIQSVLLGQNLLILSVGILIYLICSVFLPPALSFIGSLWYWAFRGAEFAQTYNHSGGIFVLLLTIYFLFRYIDKSRPSCAYGGFLSLLLLMLIRLNIGIANLIAFFFCLSIIDRVKNDPSAPRKRRLYAYFSLSALSITFLVYWFLLHPMPWYVIQQSLPYNQLYRADETSGWTNILPLLWGILVSEFTNTWLRQVGSIALAVLSIQTIILLLRNELSEKLKTNIILVFMSLFILVLFNLHEFLLSGKEYRISWIMPIITIMILYVVGMGTRKVDSLLIKVTIVITLLAGSLLKIGEENRLIQSFKKPEYSLSVGEKRVYTTQPAEWFKTVRETTGFLINNVPNNEKIFCLPFDPLYYFLSGRDGTVRQLIFFEHLNIPPEQEKETIRQLEEKKVNFIVLSSRCDTREKGMGTFGTTYCPLLARYITNHFELIATFGDWQHEADWAWNHGVKILKRR